MSFEDAVRQLNQWKKQGVLRDYVLFGAVAATAYMEPVFTEDLDVIVLVDSDSEYLSLFRTVAQLAQGQEGMHYLIGGVPVQMFPTTTLPLYRDTLDTAQKTRIGDVRVKVPSREHLMLLYLQAFRAKDHFRVLQLLENADERKLNTLLERFDDKAHTLARRLQNLRRTGLS